MPTVQDVRDRYALEGKIVTMDENFSVLERGIVYVEKGKIVAVKPTTAPPLSGFEDSLLIRTGGTIYPGLIELHNHLSYDILPLWKVPKKFSNNGRTSSGWASHSEKVKLISGPMHVLGKTPGYLEAIVRYVECKCLVAGVTTSQGISFITNQKIRKLYKGIIRNVEDTDDQALPNAGTRISDVASQDARKFLEELKQSTCKLLHLSEGTDEASRKHFEALQLSDNEWAITDALAGIHCVALKPEHFQILKKAGKFPGASMIWSPLSNLLLYGETADIRAAKESGILIGIGSDWSPSGSKNLLCELKVAHIYSKSKGGLLTDAEIVAMATINAAKILRWDKALGSIEADKRADLVVVNGRKGDPYGKLIHAKESSIALVIIDGVPRYGKKRFMKNFGDGTEELKIGVSTYVLNLKDDKLNPILVDLTLEEAGKRLQDGLKRLAELALALPDIEHAIAIASADPSAEPFWFLELEQDELLKDKIRPHLPHGEGGELTGFPTPLEAEISYPDLLKDVVIQLDPLTVIDDAYYFKRLAQQINLPYEIVTGLPRLYGVKPVLPDGADFLKDVHESVRSQFASTIELSTFLRTKGYLSLADRQRLVEQALVLLEKIYVHLPLKKAMHAIDPIQRLRLLQYRLEQQSEESLQPEIEFHKVMTGIFTSTRDLHTNYLLPSPFREKVAFLPFLIEECYEENEPKYIVSHKITGVGPPTFEKGVEILNWNGIPIRRAIDLNAENQAGSNPAARHARGLDTLTIRPLLRVMPPDEEWVTLRYRTLTGEEKEIRQKWLVFSPESSVVDIDPKSSSVGATALGLDYQTYAIQEVKKLLFAPKAVEIDKRISETGIKRGRVGEREIETSLPTVFRAESVETKHGNFGYIRIFTFKVQDADAFVNEFVHLTNKLPQKGLIVDVRGNGGGLIYAAERLLQVLTPHSIEPERSQFINTPLILELCRQHAPSKFWDDFNLEPWIDSIAQAVETGATYSRGFPITPEESCNAIGQKYHGPVVLIIDALCYSATDMFAAGFKDHDIGNILGTSGNTGAGGANVWSHSLLQLLMSDPQSPNTPLPASPFKPLPHGAEMTVAVRRTLRVGERSGIPVEDFGVRPDYTHRMTERDLLEGNVDLIDKAAEILAKKNVYTLSLKIRNIDDTTIAAQVTTKNISRLDIFLDGRPAMRSLDVTNGTSEIEIEFPKHEIERKLELKGYEEGRLVASRREKI